MDRFKAEHRPQGVSPLHFNLTLRQGVHAFDTLMRVPRGAGFELGPAGEAELSSFSGEPDLEEPGVGRSG